MVIGSEARRGYLGIQTPDIDAELAARLSVANAAELASIKATIQPGDAAELPIERRSRRTAMNLKLGLQPSNRAAALSTARRAPTLWRP